MVLALFAGAQGAPTVTVGKEIKATAGTVTKLDNGDIACYVSFKDDAGKSFTEMGDFEICFQKPSILGRRVTFTYKSETVQSPECQGDPNCKKTQQVALITSAKIVGRVAVRADGGRRLLVPDRQEGGVGVRVEGSVAEGWLGAVPLRNSQADA